VPRYIPLNMGPLPEKRFSGEQSVPVQSALSQ